MTLSLCRRPKYEYLHLNFLQICLVSYFPWIKQLWYKEMNVTVHLYQWMNLVWLMYHVRSSHSESYTFFKNNINITHNTICMEYQIIFHQQMVMYNSNEKKDIPGSLSKDNASYSWQCLRISQSTPTVQNLFPISCRSISDGDDLLWNNLTSLALQQKLDMC
jgi:hypothetical protein